MNNKKPVRPVGAPPGYRLSEADHDKIMSLNLPVTELARRIDDINYFTLWNILNHRSGASLKNYRLILTYLENIK